MTILVKNKQTLQVDEFKFRCCIGKKGSTKNKKRTGRGQGSGLGGTSTKGHKGAKSRSGYSSKIGFEGGQMPLQRRVPKFGFKNINRVEYKGINLDSIQALVDKLKIILLILIQEK